MSPSKTGKNNKKSSPELSPELNQEPSQEASQESSQVLGATIVKHTNAPKTAIYNKCNWNWNGLGHFIVTWKDYSKQ